MYIFTNDVLSRFEYNTKQITSVQLSRVVVVVVGIYSKCSLETAEATNGRNLMSTYEFS